MHGHLIDSLLLAKVIDRIQASGCSYVVTDLRIGPAKSDLSSAELQLSCADEESLQLLLDELKVHGARPVAEEDVRSSPAPAAGVAPEGAWKRRTRPLEVLWLGQWTAVPGSDHDEVVVMTQDGPRLTPLSDVNQGDLVATEGRGLRSHVGG